jgi:hypothetical protein
MTVFLNCLIDARGNNQKSQRALRNRSALLLTNYAKEKRLARVPRALASNRLGIFGKVDGGQSAGW